MKKIITLALTIYCSLSLSAQDITKVFLEIPSTILFELDAEKKDKLVSNPTDTTTISVDSHLGSIERIAISEDFISLKTSGAGTLQIKLLPLVNDSKIICVVKTVCSKACDSQVQFYTTAWVPLPIANLFPAKDISWFLKSDIDKSSDDFKNAVAAIDMNPVQLSLSEKDYSITAESDLENHLAGDDFAAVEPFISSEPKILVWDKVSYK